MIHGVFLFVAAFSGCVFSALLIYLCSFESSIKKKIDKELRETIIAFNYIMTSCLHRR